MLIEYEPIAPAASVLGPVRVTVGTAAEPGAL